MAGQMPVVVVPGGERQVDRRRPGPPAYGGDSPSPLGCRRLQYFFFWPLVFVAQFAGYIRPPPSLLPPSSPSPLPPLPLPLPLPLPPLPLPPAADLSSLVAEDLPLLPPPSPRRPQTCSRTNGEGFVVDLPYQMHNNYES